MTYTERDDKQDTTYDEAETRAEQAEENSSQHRLPFLPAADDDSPLGSTDQHSDA